VLLGTSHVFQVDQRTRAIIEQRLGVAATSSHREKAVLFRALIELISLSLSTHFLSPAFAVHIDSVEW
jgi:hypothetical protein